MQPTVTVTNADLGKTYTIRVGDVVDVALHASNGFANWVVASPNTAVLTPIGNPAAAAARGVTLRAFRAIAPGQATIAATDRPACAPGQACPQLIQGFRVTVVVGA